MTGLPPVRTLLPVCALGAAAFALSLLLPGAPAPARSEPPAAPPVRRDESPAPDAGISPLLAAVSPFRPAVPPYRFRFPRDHAAHPEFQTEWWYYTGHLSSGRRTFGYELTFFQVGLDPSRKASRSRWALHTLYFAHFAVTDEGRRRFRFTESASRPALGMAGAATERYHTWVHDWSAKLLPDDRTHRLAAAAEGAALALDLVPQKPPVVHGTDGVSWKSAGLGRASHYYSLTRLETRGTLTLDGETLPVTGLSWMDHEFGSSQLAPGQVGWDWFSIQLENGRELMLYLLRLKDGGIEPLSSGTIVEADGSRKHLPLAAFDVHPAGSWKSPRSGATYPSGWTVRVPGEALELTVTPTIPDQELVTGGVTGVTYWEGSVRVEGRDGGRPARGRGYVELTGYAGAVPGI